MHPHSWFDIMFDDAFLVSPLVTLSVDHVPQQGVSRRSHTCITIINTFVEFIVADDREPP